MRSAVVIAWLSSLLFLSGTVMAEQLRLTVHPGQAPGPSLIMLSLSAGESGTVIDSTWFDTTRLFEISDSSDPQLLTFVTPKAPWKVDFGHIKGLRQFFVVRPALADGIEVVAELTIGERQLVSNRAKVARLQDDFRDSARVAILLNDAQTLLNLGGRLIQQQPDQLHLNGIHHEFQEYVYGHQIFLISPVDEILGPHEYTPFSRWIQISGLLQRS